MPDRGPVGLVDQWQEELHTKFGMEFDLLTRGMIEADLTGSVFTEHPLLIVSRSNSIPNLVCSSSCH